MNYIFYCRSPTQISGAIDYYEKNSRDCEDRLYIVARNDLEHIGRKEFNFVSSYVDVALLFFSGKTFVTGVGDLRTVPIFWHILSFFAKKKVLVDDGVSTIWFSEKITRSRLYKNYYIHTKYCNFIEHSNEKVTCQSTTHFSSCQRGFDLFVVGGPYVEYGLISEKEYDLIISKVVSQVSAKKVRYFPHRFENKKKFSFGIDVVDSRNNIIDDIAHIGVCPRYYFSFFSSALLDCYISDNLEASRFVYAKLPGYECRGDIHNMGFVVEKRIYSLYKKIGFTEFCYED